MDLTAIQGIGPATRERLQQAGIADVEALARVPDLAHLSEWSGIAPARLATFQAAALRILDRTPSESGIVLDSAPEDERPLAKLQAGWADVPALARAVQIRFVALGGAIAATLRGTKGKSA